MRTILTTEQNTMQEYTAYLIPAYAKTNTYTVDFDGTITREMVETNVPRIGAKYHEDYIVWELNLDSDEIPALYECLFEQTEGDYYRLNDFRTMSL